MASALAGRSTLRCVPSPAQVSRRAGAHGAPRRATRSCRCSAEAAPDAAGVTQAAPLARRKALLSAAAGAALGVLPVAAPLQAADGLPEVTEKFYIDVTVDGDDAGRVVIGVFGRGPTPLAAQRFAQIASGSGGVSYRRTNFDTVRDAFVRNTGVRVFSHADPEDRTPLPLAGGESAAALLPLLTAPGALLHDRAGLVSLVALPDTPPPPPKERMVAMGGQLRTIREVAPPGPNGTGFNITLGAAPALDGTAVVVGRVLEGEAVLQALAALPTNRNADEAGLFFAVAKSIGDKRAVVAEKGFGKPLAKVSVAKSGAL